MEKFKFFQLAKLTQDKGKYFHMHIPNSLVNLLSLTIRDQAHIYVNTEQREILLKIQAPAPKPPPAKKK